MKINIKGMDKSVILATLYNASKPLGLGIFQYKDWDWTSADADKYIHDNYHAGARLYFDYVEGRVMKVDLSGDVLDTRLYDRDNGEGAAIKALFDLWLIHNGIEVTETRNYINNNSIYMFKKGSKACSFCINENMAFVMNISVQAMLYPKIESFLEDCKDVKDMTLDEKLDIYWKSHDELCAICSFNDDCERGVKSDSSGMPIFPYCTDIDYDEFVDEELLDKAIEEIRNGN